LLNLLQRHRSGIQSVGAHYEHSEQHKQDAEPERQDDERKQCEPRNCPQPGRTPAANGADGKHDRQRLDRLDEQTAGVATVQVIIGPIEPFLLGPTTQKFGWQAFRSKADLMTAITAKSFWVCRIDHSQEERIFGFSMAGILRACRICEAGNGHPDERRASS
jgi:hypothetical protein